MSDSTERMAYYLFTIMGMIGATAVIVMGIDEIIQNQEQIINLLKQAQ